MKSNQRTKVHRQIGRLLKQLQSVKSTSVLANPYHDRDCRENLRAYLQSLCAQSSAPCLLVGEALGYRGGAKTGIPFTSQRILSTAPHPFLQTLKPRLSIAGNSAEATATIMWHSLASATTVPALWNLFPFHPHKAQDTQSNRRPTTSEAEQGSTFLRQIVRILNPCAIVAAGRMASRALPRQAHGLPLYTVRHPSFGGKTEFVLGLQAIGVLNSKICNQ